MRSSPPLAVVMGVTGSGKSTVGAALAARLGVPFCEGDALHPIANMAKMHAGRPLDDADREPWLDRVAAWLRVQRAGGVVSCSALRRRYRDRLRDGVSEPLAFVLLDPPLQELERRLMARPDHFMPASLLASQLGALQRPGPDEFCFRADGRLSSALIVEAAAAWLAQAPDGARWATPAARAADER